MGSPNRAEHGRWPHTGAILAGGGSRRIGRPKQTLRLPDGRSMIDAVADVMAQVCQQVVVVGRTDAMATLQHIDDLRPGQGPLGGIEALLAGGLDTHYLVCPCDVPLVTVELLAALTVDTAAPLTVLKISGRDRPEALPARISAEALDTVRTLLDDGRRAVHQLMQCLETETIEAPAAWAEHLVNINTLAQYQALAHRAPTQ